MLGQIERGDGLLVWYTLLSLLPITLVPAAASMLGDYPTSPIALGVFAGNVIGIQLTAFVLWRHAARHRLITTGIDPRIVTGIGRRLVLVALVFAASIPLAFALPLLAYSLWIAVFAIVFATDWLSWQQANRTVRATFPLDGATSARIQLRHRTGRLHVDAADGAGALVEGVFGGGLDRKVSSTGGTADVRLAARPSSGFLSARYPWAWGRALQLDWDVGITGTIPVALTIEAADGVCQLDLGSLCLTELHLDITAAAFEVALPSGRASMRARVEVRAGSATLRVPPGVAASIATSSSTTGSVIVDTSRFEALAGLGFRSPGFEEAASRIEIDTLVSAGSIQVA